MASRCTISQKYFIKTSPWNLLHDGILCILHTRHFAAMKTQRDEKTVDLAQLLLDLDLGAPVNVKGIDSDFHVSVFIEVDENGIRVRMIDNQGNVRVPPCKTTYPFSKRLRWTRKRQNDDIQRQMRSLDPRGLLFFYFIRSLTLQNDAFTGERGETKQWSRRASWRPVEDESHCVELRSCTQVVRHAHKGKGGHAESPQTSENTTRFHVIKKSILDSSARNCLAMAFPVCQHGVGPWTKDEDSFSYAYRKPSPFKFLIHADRWGVHDHTKPYRRIHQDHKMTDFHTRAMAKCFKDLSEIPSLRYTWIQFLPSMDLLKSYDARQGNGICRDGGVCASLPRWLSVLPVLETEDDPDRQELHAMSDLRLALAEGPNPENETSVPDVLNGPLTFPEPSARLPSSCITRRQSGNLAASPNTTPTLASLSLSSKYRRSDLEVVLSDYALNLFPTEAAITNILESLVKESKTAAWYSRFFFLRPQNEAWHSRTSRFLLLAYTKTLERSRFEAGHHDEWRKLVKSIHFIPLNSGKLQSVEENMRVGLYAPEDKKGRRLVEFGGDWTKLEIPVIALGAWNNAECRKLIEKVRYVARK
ncbi:hypothetical protein QC762_703720 [Podospora pseudocomata]|uniref:Uncharacterized protein n=1 Tax=Podospora pseudocomata TaxID=2093779 RepID=A0ABR0G2Q5_9PEZI|nr:hypothetical protein QC762_703720 [Podospora pseudocomata]